MVKVVKYLLVTIFFAALFSAKGEAQTINAATCNESDVQKALNGVTSDGATVDIPAGTCTWTSTLTYNATHSMTILGAGSQSIVGGGDVTTIIDNASPNQMLQITTTAGKTFRLSGITFKGATGATGFNGTVSISGYSQAVRVDHVHFNALNDLAVGLTGWEYGVVDHCLFDLTGVHNGVRVEHANWNNGINGDASWSDDTAFGTNKAIYIEDNICNGDSNGGWIDDADNGAHLVLRHNTMNNCYFQVHDQTGDNRGPRMFEVYQNNFQWTNTGASTTSLSLRDGTGLLWGNTSSHYAGFVTLWNDRGGANVSYPLPPNGWGYCGTEYNTQGPSIWDGNQNPEGKHSGYPCIDQIGRGKGDLLTSVFPLKLDRLTNTSQWPHEAIEPVYEWLNNWTSPGYGNYWSSQQPDIIAQNRDYYLYTTSFTGASGVGSGTLAARPSTCTAGPGGNTNGVAYWATDTNTLYVCGATNSWTTYYTPYTYPHPLVTGSSASIAAPTNLAATVQ